MNSLSVSSLELCFPPRCKSGARDKSLGTWVEFSNSRELPKLFEKSGEKGTKPWWKSFVFATGHKERENSENNGERKTKGLKLQGFSVNCHCPWDFVLAFCVPLFRD